MHGVRSAVEVGKDPLAWLAFLIPVGLNKSGRYSPGFRGATSHKGHSVVAQIRAKPTTTFSAVRTRRANRLRNVDHAEIEKPVRDQYSDTLGLAQFASTRV